MSNPEHTSSTWVTPTTALKLADGSILIKHGKPVQRCNANAAEKITGVGKKILHRLAEAGFITQAKPSPWVVFYYPAEIEDFIRKTQDDPAYWTDVRRQAYLSVSSLKK